MDIPLQAFASQTRLVWGSGSVGQISAEALRFGKRVFIAISPSVKKLTVFEDILEELALSGIAHKTIEVKGEPTLEQVDLALRQARNFGAECVIGMGGGSPIDLAKAVAGLFREEAPVLDFFYGKPANGTGIPLIAVPTVAGSGAEVTPNAVLSNTDSMVKLSIKHLDFTPKVAIIDPELMTGVGPQTTAYSGMDGLCQAIEAFTSKGANAFTDVLAKEATLRFARHLPEAVANGANLAARESLALASAMGGMALSVARLGAVHGLAHPIGIRYGQPHGKVCAVLLPIIMDFNIPVAGAKYAKLSRALGMTSPEMSEVDQATELVRYIIALNKRLNIPHYLRELGIVQEDFPALIAESLPSGSLKANPRAVGAEDIATMLRENW